MKSRTTDPTPPAMLQPPSDSAPSASAHHPRGAARDLPAGILQLSSSARRSRLIGDVVVDLGFADRDVVDRAVETARNHGKTTGEVLVDTGTITPDQLARVLAERFGVDYVDLTKFAVDTTATTLISSEAARHYNAVPIGFLDERTLLLATADGANVVAIDDIAMMTEYEIHPLVASRTDLAALIAKVARFDDVSAAEEEDDDFEISVADIRDDAEDAPVVKLVHSVIAEAIEIGASDIHLEPEGTELRVYYRIDGVLTSSTTIPRNLARGVISRIKIMANLDIAEKRLPQDGRLALGLQGRMVDVRVASLPLVTGESVVMRILDHGGGIIDLESLGIHSEDSGRLRHALAQPYGLVLVTGPTGSGKTTTLYGSLEVLNTGDRSIITIEDPVEYKMSGIKQIQVHSRIGLGFATGLRSMVRADPDVMMVGEIRDRETAQIAVEAALTGHLVLSTMHTRDAATAAPRLVDMGIEPFLVASAVDCVIAQRLARKLCVECKKPVVIPAEALRNAGLDGDGDLEAFEAVGCGRCGDTGYRGRTGLYEVLTVTDEIRSLIVRGSSGEALRDVALSQGMRTLRMDGFDKVRQGVTSLAETARVAGS